MRTSVLYLFVGLVMCYSCKEGKENKESALPTDNHTEGSVVVEKDPAFEDQLLDLRDVNVQFNDQYKIEKFGMLKHNDSVFSFVFRLDENVVQNEVSKFSVGVKGFNFNLNEPYRASFSPDIEIKDNRKYLLLRRKIDKVTYFDSLEVYTYNRNDWKSSGRIAGFKIRDILFE